MLFLIVKDSQHKCTAGVYLLIRSSPLIEYSNTVLLLCLWVGAITTVFSSLIGLFQQDIKKVIAYSTMSQLARECNIHSIIFMHQTICVEVKIMINKFINSQITKALDKLYIICQISYNLFNSPLIYWLYNYIFAYVYLSVRWKIIIISKLVGISEAIRLILIFIKRIIILYSFFFQFHAEQEIKKFFISCSAKNKYIFILISTYIYNKVLSLLSNGVNYIYLSSCLPFFPAKLLRRKGWGHSYIRNIHTHVNTAPVIQSEEVPSKKDKSFNEWLAGLLDGDGYFILTKKGYTSCEITMDARDKKALNEIKHRYGGTIKSVSNANGVRYKLRHKKGLISLINDVNGLIRNPIRLLQINKLCVKYNIHLKYPEPLSFNNGWLSGFIDSDGSIYYNEASGQVFISLTQKNKFLLEPLIAIYGGRVDILSPKIEAFKYIVYRKSELFNLIDSYFNHYPLKTEKMKRVNLIKDFFLFRIDRNSKDIVKFNEWVKFKDKWEKYQD